MISLIVSGFLLTACQESSSVSDSTASSTTNLSQFFSDRDLDASYDSDQATKIDLEGETVTISGTGASLNGQELTISVADTHFISGSSDTIRISVKAADADQVQLVLNGVEMSAETAPIYFEEADKVILTLADGTTNTISDAATNSNTKLDAAIFSKSNLTINGSGSLIVNGRYYNAIEGNDDVCIYGSHLELEAVGDGINANDALNIKDATVTIAAGHDGLHSDNAEDVNLGNLYVGQAQLTAQVGDDGIHASNALIVNTGEITITQSTEAMEGKKHSHHGRQLESCSQ
ncbi:carbohydrate-binding domain-containing protein [Streptococcus suis]|nr:carbohydrate-binding domain-containing protein [Streptococcus suis]